MTLLTTDLADIVRTGPFGRDLSPSQIDVLAELLELRHCVAGEVVAREGQVDDRLVVVVDGALDAVKHIGTPNETVLATVAAGGLAHELGFLDGTPRYSTLVAASATRVLVLQRAQLESLIERDPHILYAVMRAIVRTAHAVQTRLSVQAAELTNYVVKQHGRY